MKTKLILTCVILINTVYGNMISLTLENDTFKMPSSDDDYTHGTTFEYVDDSFMHYKFQQNMYAPSDLKRKDHIKGDRPYAGMLIGSAGYDFFRDFNPFWTHYGEVNFGMIGPAAFAGHTQRMVHRILGCRKPEGWHNQLHNEFVVNVQWWEKYNWYLCDYVALVPRAGVLAGTIQDAIEAGCDLKVGWNLKNDSGNSMMFSAPSNPSKKSFFDKLGAWTYIGADERYYLYNHILEGSFIRNRDKGLDVPIEPFVGELQWGMCLQYENFTARYYMCVRQHEYKHQKHSPNYAGLSFSWSW